MFRCMKCKKIWNKKELLYEPLLGMYKCPKCRIFTPLIKLEQDNYLEFSEDELESDR